MDNLDSKDEQFSALKGFAFKNIRYASKAKLTFLIIIMLTLFQMNALAQIFWLQTNGTESRHVKSIITNVSEYYFAGTIDSGVYRSSDNGAKWCKKANDSLTNNTVQVLLNKSNKIIFAGTRGGGVFRSSNYGNSWQKVNNGLIYPYINSLVVTSTGFLLAGTTLHGIFRSENNGDRWEKIENNALTSSTVFALVINRENSHIFAGTFGPGIFRSIDDGNSWKPVNEGLSNFDINSLAFNDEGHLFAGTSEGVYRSINEGDLWNRSDSGLPNVSIKAFAINKNKHIFAATESGVFRSTDNGNTWAKFSAGLPDYPILTVATDTSGRLFAGTAGGGVYRARDAALPVIRHSPQISADKQQQIPINAQATDDTGIEETTLFFRRGGDLSFDSLPMANTNGLYTNNIPTEYVTDRGVEYYIIASDSFDNVRKYPEKGYLSVQVIVDEPGAVSKYSQIAGSDQIAYRLVSVPLDLKNRSAKAVLEDDLGKYDNKKWRLYELRDDYPDSIPPYREYDDKMEIEPGNACWLIVKEEGKKIDTGPGISFSTASKYEIVVHPKWNFIGNPFNFSIPIRNLQLKKGALVLQSYSGEWKPVTAGDSLRAFEGLALFADSIDTLQINPDLSDISSTFSNYANPLTHEKIIGSIRIIAQCDEARDEDNLAVIASDALIDKDRKDQPEPPPIGEYVSVYFPHRDWKTIAKTYCIDARPEPLDGDVWEFEIKTNIRDIVDLSFEGLEKILKEFEILLVDSALNIIQNLRETSTYSIAAQGTERPKNLKLVVGKSSFIESKLAGLQLVPTGYQLFQNFPNPFNPATTIRYGLMKAERVTLKVYNLLGEQVVTLVNNEPKKAGYYAVIWDGRNQAGMLVANGIYFVYMQAGKFRQSRKMLLVQ